MPLDIPDSNHLNMIMTIENTNGGASARSSISLGFEVGITWDQAYTNAVANIARDQLKTIWDNGWKVGPCTFIQGPTISEQVWVDPTQEVGTATAADYASPAVALVVTKRTTFRGKKFRGRFYLPGVPETLVGEGGVLDATYLANVQTMLDGLQTDLVATTAIQILTLFHDTSTPGSHTPTPITRLEARSPVATMRPRQRR